MNRKKFNVDKIDFYNAGFACQKDPNNENTYLLIPISSDSGHIENKEENLSKIIEQIHDQGFLFSAKSLCYVRGEPAKMGIVLNVTDDSRQLKFYLHGG
jgi:hypothetical protein